MGSDVAASVAWRALARQSDGTVGADLILSALTAGVSLLGQVDKAPA